MTSFVRRPPWAALIAIPISFAATIAIVAISNAYVFAAGSTAEDGQLPAEFLRAQQANAAALREYTWKSRTELSLKGEVKFVTLEQIRHDLDGRRQKTRIGGTPDPSEEHFDPLAPRVGPVRRIVAARKKEEFQDLLRDLAALAESYAHPPLETLHVFARQAARTKTIEAGQVRVQGRNVVVAGDSMTVWIDRTTGLIRRAEIETTREGERVEMAVDYRSLPNGLTYQARTLLRYPSKQMSLTVETYEHQHVQGGSR